MLGPLPRLYRILVAVVAIVFFVGAGVWANQMVEVTLPGRGALLGVALGAAVSFLLLHDFGDGHPDPARARKPR